MIGQLLAGLPAFSLAAASLLLAVAPISNSLPHPAAADAVVINEILAHTDLPDVDSVELFNQGDTPVDLSGWLMTDDRTKPETEWVRVPDGTVINAGSFYVIENCGQTARQLTRADCARWPFGLSEAGDDVFILRPDTSGGSPALVAHANFGVSPNGVSFGRYIDSVGAIRYPLLETVTLGAANSPPLASPVVIEEIMYHPPDGYSEYVVIANASARAVALQDGAHATNTWRLVGRDDSLIFEFPSGTILAPGERIIVAAVAPEQFRKERSIPTSVRIFGPTQSKLSNDGEQVALTVPQPPELDGITVYYAHVDDVAYQSSTPWPPADGNGLALARIDATAYGNDVANWRTTNPLARVNSTLYLPAVSNGAAHR